MLDFLSDHLWTTLLVINYLVVLIVAIYIIRHNRNPVSTLSYILSMVVFPFVGIVVYFFIGQEYRKEKMFVRKRVFDNQKIKVWEQKLLQSDAELQAHEKLLQGKVKLVKLLQNNQRKPLTFNNEVKVLINGENKFKALFADIEKAEKHIHVEYYIFNSDQIGKKFADKLCQKAQAGIEVRVSYDYVASDLSDTLIEKMKSCGIEIHPFMPVRFPNLARKLNYRNHRKIVVIDGKIGYVGGINVSDEYVNPGKKGIYWRDTHLRVCGDAVKSLQTQFILNWNFVSGKDLEIKDVYYPILDAPKGKAVQMTSSGPDSDWANIMEAIFTVVNMAKNYIYITTPYFIPNEQILTALKTASRSGVEVRLLIPHRSDTWITKYAGDSYIQELLESQIKVFHYTKGMIHAKTMVVDDDFVMIGTANMDYRSFEINFETNALVYDNALAREMVAVFEKDMSESQAIDFTTWKKRTHIAKWKESICRLWAPLL